MRIEGRVGVQRSSDDQLVPPRIGNQGELICADLNPMYYEQTMRGNAFIYAVPAAGAVLAALGTTSAPLIWNPAGSGKVLVITKVVAGLVATGTTAAGHIVYGFQNNLGSQTGTAAPVVSLTAVAAVNACFGHPNTSVMRFAPTTISLTAACTFLCSMGGGQATAATTATSPFLFIDDVGGRIQVLPGSAFTVGASGSIASTYSVTIYGLELPLALVA